HGDRRIRWRERRPIRQISENRRTERNVAPVPKTGAVHQVRQVIVASPFDLKRIRCSHRSNTSKRRDLIKPTVVKSVVAAGKSSRIAAEPHSHVGYDTID